MNRSDLVIRNVVVVDGTGTTAPYPAEVAVTGDRVASVGPELPVEGGVEVDGGGACLAPGFIDIHTHDDAAVLIDPLVRFKLLQGVTTVVVGNCGWGPQSVGWVAGLVGPGHVLPSWATHAEYAALLDAEPPSCNVAVLAGHGSMRSEAIGRHVDRLATPAELAHMHGLLHEALEAGVFGMSTGLAYEPGTYAPTAEVVALAGDVADAGGIYTSHVRDEAAGVVKSVAEAIRVGEEAGLPCQISHHKVAGREHWGDVGHTLGLIDEARARGVDVAADQYPYTAGSTSLDQVLRQGGLGGPSVSGTRPFGRLRGGDVHIAAAPNRPEWEGHTLDELAAMFVTDVRTAAERVEAEAGRGTMVVLEIMSEDDVRRVLAHPTTMIGSDGLPVGSKAHPRLWGPFPRVLGRYCRELGVLDLTTAVHRMTGMSARRFGLADRGVIAPGAYADLVLFDPGAITDIGTYDDPARPPVGITGVWVNGRRAVVGGGGGDGGHGGWHTRDRSGRLLRRGGS